MEKDILQELKYDLERERDLNSQIDLVIVAADMLCAEVQQDAWDFFRVELNDALMGTKNITDMLRQLERNLRDIKIKVIL